MIFGHEQVESVCYEKKKKADEFVLLQSKRSAENVLFQPCVLGTQTFPKIAVAVGMNMKSQECMTAEEIKSIMNLKPDFLIELSIGDLALENLRKVREYAQVPLGCSPTYTIIPIDRAVGPVDKTEFLFRIREICEIGVDFICLPLGISLEFMKKYKNEWEKRIIPVTSRCGEQIINYMKWFDKENPFLEYLDEIIEICVEFNIAIDTGDIFRTGCIEDSIDDEIKFLELKEAYKAAEKISSNGLGVIFEGGGHFPISKIKEYVKKIRAIIGEKPLWFGSVLGSDRAIGKDSVANCIGIYEAAMEGVNAFLTITNSEHFACPDVKQTIEAIKDMKVALSIVKAAKFDKNELRKNKMISVAREKRDWDAQIEHSLFPEFTKNLFLDQGLTQNGIPCNMCGKYCPLLKNKGIR